MAEPLLQVKNLKVHFFTPDGVVKAVDGVDFEVPPGKTMGIVGESGCGKSVTAFAILQLVGRPGRIIDGQVVFNKPDGEKVDLAALEARSSEMRSIRGGDIAMIFQEPMNSLSPVMTVGNQIIEAVMLHQEGVTKAEAREKAIEMLRLVGIPRPEDRVDAYTFQLSGGMRQRAMIAMALSCNPHLLIADEPTTALDVTIQAQIMALIKRLQTELGMSVILITHDLGVVAETCDEVVVMYLGEVVERANVDSLFYDPLHPYTQALLKSIPRLGASKDQKLDTIQGSVPSPHQRPTGCLFHDRCEKVIIGRCDRVHPELKRQPDGRMVRCLLYEEEGEEAVNG
jgi:peptide/nickel transport system ATP-binding protein